MRKANLEKLQSFITADGSAIRELAGRSGTAEHYHPQAEELYYFVSGEGRMRLGGQESEVGIGDCVTIAPGTPHKLWNTGPGQLVLLCCCAPAYSDDDTVMTGG